MAGPQDGAEAAGLPAELPFVKMHGAGNDFVLIDRRTRAIPEGALSRLARALCRRRLSLGADGLVVIDDPAAGPDRAADFRWRYFNADGSEGELCGNGAMCAARWWWETTGHASCRFSTRAGMVGAAVESTALGIVAWLQLPDAGPLANAVTVTLDGRDWRLWPCRVGVPHAVLIVSDADEWADTERFERWGSAVRHHPIFAPEGTNVDVISIVDTNRIRMRTYERGVERETLACGTGAVASAAVAAARGSIGLPATIATSSGDPLFVELSRDGDMLRGVRLGGLAHLVARGTLTPEAWRLPPAHGPLDG